MFDGEGGMYASAGPGETGRSETVYGDVIVYESPFRALRVMPDLVPEDPYPDGGIFLQTAEVIGDRLFVVTAEGRRAPEADIGWRTAYSPGSMHWYCAPVEEYADPLLLIETE